MNAVKYIIIFIIGFAFYALLQEARFQTIPIEFIPKKRGEEKVKKQGMIWYAILKYTLPIGVVINLYMPSNVVYESAQEVGVSFHAYFSTAPWYFSVYIVGGIVYAIISAALVYQLWKKGHLAAPLTKLLISYYTLYLALMLLTSYPIIDYIDPYIIGSAFRFYIIWIPSYYYIKKRTASELSHFSQQRPPETQNQPASIFELIPMKLHNVTDQRKRDQIVSDLLRGNKNPYTDEYITCEADWNKYVNMYNADKERSTQKENNHDEVLENSSYGNDEPSKFCRKCGKPLRNDSVFCEHCGTSVK